MKNWLNVQALAGSDGVAKITIDGIIGRGWWEDDMVASNDFMNQVKSLGELTEIQIDMNSPGGSVTDGLTIANYLREHSAKVIVNVLGQASSIASVIAAAADVVNMGLGSFMLVHQPWSAMAGNADEFRAEAKALDTIMDGIMDAYLARVGEERRDELMALIKGDDYQGTILSASDAVALGLADSMLESKAAASACMTSLFQAMAAASEELREKLGSDQEEDEEPAAEDLAVVVATALGISAADVLGDLTGLADRLAAYVSTSLESVTLTLGYLEENQKPLLAEIRKAAGDAAAAAEIERVVDIVRACKTYGTYDSLEKLVSENWSAKQASDHMLAVAEASGSSIHSSHSPSGGHKATIDVKAIYGRRNQRSN